jgi:hypothetical protein
VSLPEAASKQAGEPFSEPVADADHPAVLQLREREVDVSRA